MAVRASSAQPQLSAQHQQQQALRLQSLLSQYGVRKLILSLESDLPTERAWALHSLLLASSDAGIGDSAGVGLEAAASLARHPGLLKPLLFLALPPPGGEGRQGAPGFPPPPWEASARALAVTQRRQAWLILRNMACMPENETPLGASHALRRLVLSTLQRGVYPYDALPALSADELQVAGEEERRGAEEPTEPPPAQTQCQLNPFCVRGYRHGGRGGPCRILKPVADSFGGRSGRGRGSPMVGVSAAVAAAEEAAALLPCLSGAPTLFSAEYGIFFSHTPISPICRTPLFPYLTM